MKRILAAVLSLMLLCGCAFTRSTPAQIRGQLLGTVQLLEKAFPAGLPLPPESPLTQLPAQSWYMQEDCALLEAPEVNSPVLALCNAGTQVTLVGYVRDYAQVQLAGQTGYIPAGQLLPVLGQTWVADCEEYIGLRSRPGGDTILARILPDEEMTLLSWTGQYAQVAYNGQTGYVLGSYIRPGDDLAMTSLRIPITDVYTYEQMCYDISLLAAAYSETLSVDSIGTSELGREIPVLRIGDPDAQHHVLIQGAIHAREHMTAWLLMALTDYWLLHRLSAYGDVCYHIIPMVNPDGVTVAQSGLQTELQMQIYQRDLANGYAVGFAQLYTSSWKANGKGVDLNRNFPSGWEPVSDRSSPSAMLYKGPTPFSAAETRALRDYTLAYPFGTTVSYHSNGSLIYYQYGDRQPANDLSEAFALPLSAITGYPLIGSYGIAGAGYKDWAIQELGIPSVTMEVGCQSSPLALREAYNIFYRNLLIFPAIGQWMEENA